MKIYLQKITMFFKQKEERISFHNINFFYGKMGSGKSTIARLIDFCFGGTLELSPALQTEFVAVTLELTVSGVDLILYRERGSNQIRTQWTQNEQLWDAVIPARIGNGEVIPDTGVEVLSDLFFYLSGSQPPKVRKSKIKEDSDLSRLSMRDLLWYCYLDQDDLDSNFFKLDDANFSKRNKSKDVLRFIIGFHQEKVAELESRLDEVRLQRMSLFESAKSLKSALEETGISTDTDIETQINLLRERMREIDRSIQVHRLQSQPLSHHAVDTLRDRGRSISIDLQISEEALLDVIKIINDNNRHLNELRMLTLKIRRGSSARAVLGKLNFEACPRCTQYLPDRQPDHCPLCGQIEVEDMVSEDDIDIVQKDIESRKSELLDIIHRHQSQKTLLQYRIKNLKEEKIIVDARMNEELQRYDSAYLSSTLLLEQDRAEIVHKISELERLKILFDRVQKNLVEADTLIGIEQGLRRDLKELRILAEQDNKNIKRLEELFLDCLIRTKITGFSTTDVVEIKGPHFLPEVYTIGSKDMVFTSFANMNSGGKKTLFKCCFAIAIHRLAQEVGALLPTLLIIDSPMKNISERENKDQFEAFYTLIYDLAATELRDIQFMIIDHEFYPAPETAQLDIFKRYMTPNDPYNPPLISYLLSK